MARRVFFSFHYERDLWRVNVVRNSGLIEGFAIAGFHDASLWQEAKRKGESAIKQLVDKGLARTSVTAVLIGAEIASRRWISYEIEQSAKRRNGILGIRINSIKDQYGRTDVAGPIPAVLLALQAPVYDWEYGKLSQWVEQAFQAAQR
jgi:hypothetical protein